MDFADVLAQRRMVRNYLPDPIKPDMLRRVASAAMRAPSAGYSQGFLVVVVTEDEKRRQIAELAGEEGYVSGGFDPWISRAPAHIVIAISEQAYHDRYQESDKLGDENQEIAWPIPFWWVDAGASMMAVLLAAVNEGLAAGFLGVHAIPDLKDLLDLPGEFEPIGVITVGYRAPDRRSRSLARGQRPQSETLHFESYRAPADTR